MRLLYHLPDRDISLPWIYTFRGAKVHTIFQLTKWAGGAFRGGANNRRKLGFFIQNQLGNWQKTAKI